MRTLHTIAAALVTVLFCRPVLAETLDGPAMLKILQEIDDRQRNGGDYKALVYLEQKEKDKTDTVHEALVYRRDADNKLMILFTKPKTEQGSGYLRIDNNLWFYDPSVGRWERRTERERIAGTDSRRADFDESRLAEEYTPSFKGEDKLGRFDTWVLELKVKDGVDVAFPVLKLWVDKATHNVLKRQEFALSGKLMRTAYYPKWKKVYSESKQGEVWYPEEMRFFDEIEKANSTLVLIKSVDLRPLEANMFTKAWLESKSR
ncbi:MAG: outer membrane lipoprotein-sorting protein [Myxococcaceae bacterium]|nr:outer membrane lipoprotein-sorting protein [Myxococcaceae bacterium]